MCALRMWLFLGFLVAVISVGCSSQQSATGRVLQEADPPDASTHNPIPIVGQQNVAPPDASPPTVSPQIASPQTASPQTGPRGAAPQNASTLNQGEPAASQADEFSETPADP